MNRKTNTGKIVIITASIILAIVTITAVVLCIVLPVLNKDGSGIPENAEELGNDYSEPASENVVTDEDTGERYVNNEILISASEGTRYSEIESLVKERNGEIVGYIEAFDEYQIRLNDSYTAAELEALADELEQDNRVESASINYAMALSDTGYFTPNDPWDGGLSWDRTAPEGNNWGVEAINAPQAWDHRDEMNEITIGLIDSGFEDHEDLTFSWTRCSGTDNHGCHVAGIMAADFNNNKGIAGVMPTQKSNGDPLVKLIGVTQKGDTFNEMFTFEFKSVFAELLVRHTKVINVSQGFNWYLGKDNGWDKSYWNNNNITQKAENLATSYGTQVGTFLSRCLHRGYDFLVVCAAGNDGGIDARYNSPLTAITDEEVVNHIVVVGSVKNLGKETGLFSSGKHKGYDVSEFSNLGERVDIMAPGSGIYSCISDNKYDVKSGTSMASPHVAGVCSMVWSLDPNAKGSAVKDIVTGTADRPVTKNGRSYNILNAENAVNRALGNKGDRPTDTATEPTPHYGSVISRIVDSYSWEMLSDSVVKAYTLNGEYVDEATLDENGQFELLLEEGEYNLTASTEGYEPETIEHIKVEKEQVNYIEWFYLKHLTDDVLSGTYVSQDMVGQRFTFSGQDEITMNAFGVINAKGNYYIDGDTIFIHFSSSLDIGDYSIQLTDTENGYLWEASYSRVGDSAFISGLEFRKEGSGPVDDPGDETTLMGTYVGLDGLQYFTFSKNHTVNISLTFISTTGTYELSGDTIVIRYTLFGQSETWETSFSRSGSSIFIGGDEYIKQ